MDNKAYYKYRQLIYDQIEERKLSGYYTLEINLRDLPDRLVNKFISDIETGMDTIPLSIRQQDNSSVYVISWKRNKIK